MTAIDGSRPGPYLTPETMREFTATMLRSLKHFRQAHSKLLSLGIAKWPHLPQAKRPPERAAIGINSSPNMQYGHRTTVILMAIFSKHTCFASTFRRLELYALSIRGM
jgi:hypothetical protein